MWTESPAESPLIRSAGRQWSCAGEGLRYVGRGGLKLEGAIRDFALFDVLHDKIAADLGASTGGFTQCLLSAGVKKVYAIENGSGQLHPLLRDDPRVISMEHCNAREITQETLPERCGAAVMDLSFISQTLIYPVIPFVLEEGGLLLSLVKPQFEAGRGEIGKNGIVKDRKVHLRVLERLMQSAYERNLYALGGARSRLPAATGMWSILFCSVWEGSPFFPLQKTS